MELSNLDKRNLQKDLDLQDAESIDCMLTAAFNLYLPEDYHVFCDTFGVDINTPKERAAKSVIMMLVSRLFMFIDADAPLFITLPNFAEGRGYTTTEQLKRAITPEIKDYMFSLVPDYVNRNVDMILGSNNALEEFCRIQMDIVNGRVPDTSFADGFDWGF